MRIKRKLLHHLGGVSIKSGLNIGVNYGVVPRDHSLVWGPKVNQITLNVATLEK